MSTRYLNRAGFGWMIAVLAGIALAGCRPAADTTGKSSDGTASMPAGSSKSTGGTAGRIVVLSNTASPFWVAVERGMNDAAAELGADVELMRSDGTVAGQIQRLEQIGAQSDIKGVAISVLDAGSKGVIDRMTDLRKKGVHVVTIDSDGPKPTRFAYIGANNVNAGEQAGRAAAKLAPNGAKVIAFVGTQAAANARERIAGFKKGAGAKFEIVDVMEDGNNMTKARQNVTAAIQSHPEVTMLLGLWSYNAPAIAEEVTRAGKRARYKIVTFDAEPNTIPQLAKGTIDATVIQQPYEYGRRPVRLLHALIQGDEKTVKQMAPESGIIEVPCHTVITDPNGPISKGGNVITFEELKEYLDEKGLKGT